MSIKLDLNQFKHVKSDDKSTTLKHKNGHMLTLAHNVLSKNNQEQLKVLSKIGPEAATEGQKQEAQDQSQYGKVIMKKDGGTVFDPNKAPNPPDPNKAKGIANVFKGDSEPNFVEKGITAVGNAIGLGKAEGGEIEKPSHCEHCGSPRKMYANTEELVSQQDSAPTYDPIMSGVRSVGKALKPTADSINNAATAQMYGHDAPGNYNSAQDSMTYQPPNENGVPEGIQPNPLPATPDSKPPQTALPKKEDKSALTKKDETTTDTTTPIPDQNTGMLQQAYRQAQAGASGMASAVGNLGEAQADIQKNQAEAQNLAISKYDEQKQELNQERLGHIQAIKDGQIDPNKYWDSHDKLITGIGLVLAGFNPTSHPNAAIDFLKSQMEQNVNAQAKNLDSHQNLLSANIRQFGNLKDGADMTRVMQADYVSHKLGEAAANAQTPMAQASALTAQSQINKEFQPLFMNLNLRKSAINIANSGQPHSEKAIESMIAGLNSSNDPSNKALGKQIGEAYIPGVGITRTLEPVSEDTKKQILNMKIMDDKGKDVLNFIKSHPDVWNSESDKNVVKQKMEELKNFYNGSIGGGALTEGRLGWYGKQFSEHPLNKINQFMGSTKRIEEIVNSNGQRLNTVLQQQGIDPIKSLGAPQQAQAKPKTVVQGGHTFHLNPKTGKYE